MATWLDQVFDAKQVAAGGIVRRNKADVDRICALPSLLAEVKHRGFHLIEVGDQYVVICNSGQLQVHC